MSKMNLKTASLVIAGVALFFVGLVVGKSANSAGSVGLANLPSADRQARFGMGGGTRDGINGGFSSGEVTAKDATGITLKMRDGSSKIVLTSGNTQVMKSSSGSMGDVMVGQEVTVTGSSNPDGSLTAQSIQIRPATPATAK